MTPGFEGRTAPDGKPVRVVTLSGERGFEARFLTWGATWLSCRVPVSGSLRDVLFHPQSFEDLLAARHYPGALIGRFANRIAGGRYELDGETHNLTRNEGHTTLHGGRRGFDRFSWDVVEETARQVTFSRRSPDGEEGFPGNLDVRATWRLEDPGTLELTVAATCDKPTAINLTAHPYFNLGCPVSEHGLEIFAETPDINCLLDPIGSTELDHAFLLRGNTTPTMRRAAKLTSPPNDLCLTLLTDKPALQVYNGQPVGIALEPEFLPDSPNIKDLPHEAPFLEPGESYRYKMIYQFGNE